MRTMLKGMVAAMLVAGFAMSAHAETKPGTPTPGAEAKNKAGAKDKRYCLQTKTTGSRIARKECKTRANWLLDGFDPLDPK